jgi:hypothetical protein
MKRIEPPRRQGRQVKSRKEEREKGWKLKTMEFEISNQKFFEFSFGHLPWRLGVLAVQFPSFGAA